MKASDVLMRAREEGFWIWGTVALMTTPRPLRDQIEAYLDAAELEFPDIQVTHPSRDAFFDVAISAALSDEAAK